MESGPLSHVGGSSSPNAEIALSKPLIDRWLVVSAVGIEPTTY